MRRLSALVASGLGLRGSDLAASAAVFLLAAVRPLTSNVRSRTASDKVVGHAPVGQAPQALVYVSNAVPAGEGTANLVPRVTMEPINIALKSNGGEAKGFVVARNLGLVDSLEEWEGAADPAKAILVSSK